MIRLSEARKNKLVSWILSKQNKDGGFNRSAVGGCSTLENCFLRGAYLRFSLNIK
jgi:hypothetical protein